MNIYVETYGCTANKSDERLLLGLLQQKGHQIVPDISGADVLVLLTCTVIATTEQRMLSRLQVFHKTHKKIIVTGCMPAVQKDLILSVAPQATLLSSRYIQYINDIINGDNPVFVETKKTTLPKYYDTALAPILISEGCRLSCSYCITHFAKGALRSFAAGEIVTDVCSALKQGCKEIQLTAQDTASYGLDTGTNLGTLLKRISTLDGAFRIRVGMMNPLTLQKNLDSVLKAYQHPNIYKFLHLPVQSGDDEILQKMNRGYTIKEFTSLIHHFREAIPSLTLSTDVIIGFPTETDEQFDRTIELLKEIRPDIVNITRFSARPLTLAKKMKGRIPTHVVKTRSKQATEVCAKLSLEKNKQHLGKTYSVLVTEPGKKKTVTGRSDSYKQVVLTEPVPIGSFVQVKIIHATSTYLVGKLI
ncbi:MAG TPA: tRNA (N(6)-L-threonylcarbamoyladenosine(37)-C(2))-methylthiotransferase [Candidatus Thermoplasmatota archaeon]|nr:tRNA (N(6)-L-threonylcarbamoyladenosine(37)-C(2))-methylthiotransferase [Candidatus Thermoplasmatota archaeon]